MDSTRNTSLAFYTLLDQGLLMAAFDRLRRYGEKKLLWELTDELKRLRQSYLYMIRYALSGSPDPKRNEIKQDIVSRLADIYVSMRRTAESAKSSDIYFSTEKSLRSRQLRSIVSEYREQLRRSGDFMAAVNDSVKDGAKPLIEGLERDIFNKIWTLYPLQSDDKEVIVSLLDDKSVPERLRHLIAGALTLGNMRYFDDRKFGLLADIYTNDSADKVALNALIGLLLSLFCNRERPVSRKVINRLKALAELPHWHNDINSVTLELVRTHDTKRISDTMTDYFASTFSKVSDQVKQSMSDLSKIEDLTELEENPEWMEMLEKTGLADKMKELTELQEEGGDVFLQPFRQLKSDPFFYEAANWFIPFYTSHSAVERIDSDGMLAEMVAMTPFLCDNDKYSFMLSIARIPEEQRKLMLSQLEAGNMGMAQEMASSLNLNTTSRRNIINKGVQSLYRFFSLYRRRDDFGNPFDKEINLTSVAALDSDLSDPQTLSLVAEFYFRHKYHREALPVLLRLEKSDIPTAELYQKIGYCYQRTGNLDEALRYYEQAELLNAQSSWTLRRIAQCLSLLGRFGEAADYYRRLNTMLPDNFKIILSTARCLAAEQHYTEALPYLYQVHYLNPQSEDVNAMLAWVNLAAGDREKASRYFDDIDPVTTSRTGRIRLGHLSLIEGDAERALALYTRDMNSDEDYQAVVSAIAADFPALKQYGFTTETRDLLIEAITASALDR